MKHIILPLLLLALGPAHANHEHDDSDLPHWAVDKITPCTTTLPAGSTTAHAISTTSSAPTTASP
ncbi:hypothetical protein MBH78_09875 [Oceanimonas sp. NS1]|nr:hypothetical protein [Oceanimonas sp. NS1]